MGADRTEKWEPDRETALGARNDKPEHVGTMVVSEPTDLEDTCELEIANNRISGDRTTAGGGEQQLPKIQTPSKGEDIRRSDPDRDQKGNKRPGNNLNPIPYGLFYKPKVMGGQICPP